MKTEFAVEPGTTIGWIFPKGLSKVNGYFHQQVQNSLRGNDLEPVSIYVDVASQSQLTSIKRWDVSVAIIMGKEALLLSPSVRKKANFDRRLMMKNKDDCRTFYFRKIETSPPSFRTSRIVSGGTPVHT